MPLALVMGSLFLGIRASSASKAEACSCAPADASAEVLAINLMSGTMPPISAMMEETFGLKRARRTMMMAAISGARRLSAESMPTSGEMAPLSTIMEWLSVTDARCQIVLALSSWASGELLFTSLMIDGIAFDLEMRT